MTAGRRCSWADRPPTVKVGALSLSFRLFVTCVILLANPQKIPAQSEQEQRSPGRLAVCYWSCKGEKFSCGRKKNTPKTPPQHGFGGKKKKKKKERKRIKKNKRKKKRKKKTKERKKRKRIMVRLFAGKKVMFDSKDCKNDLDENGSKGSKIISEGEKCVLFCIFKY